MKTHQLVPSNIYQRVVRIITEDEGSATGFTLEIDNTQYLITAKHVLSGEGEQNFKVAINTDVKELSLLPLKGLWANLDVAVFKLDFELTPTLPVVPSLDGLIISQECFFLGYPSDLSGNLLSYRGHDGSILAFVKKGIISAIDWSNQNRQFIYVDGINNPGFSGGPLVFINKETGRFHIAGVINGYYYERLSMQDTDTGETSITNLLANSGIVIATGINHVHEIIKHNKK